MSEINDGGPAFPDVGSGWDRDSGQYFTQSSGGMSLRDYAAIHSTQPGMSEIAKAAGVGFVSCRIYHKADTKHPIPFDEWWSSMTLEQQCLLSARVRYAQADAMLHARAEGVRDAALTDAYAQGRADEAEEATSLADENVLIALYDAGFVAGFDKAWSDGPEIQGPDPIKRADAVMRARAALAKPNLRSGQ